MMKGKNVNGITSFGLHILAMILMLCDHLWATLLSDFSWLTWIGRIAFPLFAFMIVEGFFHTKDRKKYILRMLIFAVISEIPFNMIMSGGGMFYPYHQNVLWTFLIALMGLSAVESVRKKGKPIPTALTFVGVFFAGFLVGMITMVDYYGFGVMTVMIFYLFRGRKWWHYLGQLAGLYWINLELLGGLYVPVMIGGREIQIVQQGMALLALIPIWLYKGEQGPYNKTIKAVYYWFYPVHILVLSVLAFVL